MAIGLLPVVKTEWFLYNFGRIGFFETHMAIQGGSRLGYKLIGLIIIFVGLLVTVNLFGGLMEVITHPITRYQDPVDLQLQYKRVSPKLASWGIHGKIYLLWIPQ